jgi:putative photosynthetic complex assembly protein 2
MALLSHPAAAALCALLVWWLSTGILLYVVGLAPRTFRWSRLAASLLFMASLWGLAESGADPSVAGAYRAFTWAIVLWGMLEVGFLLGSLTGPRGESCPKGCAGWQRARYAIEAILYHELALLASGAAAIAITWNAANQVGAWILLVLWTMRLSAKLNLFFGVPILNEHFLPDHLRYLASYFTRGPLNFLFPLVIAISAIVTVAIFERALDPSASPAAAVGLTLVATMMVLAIAEHLFMVLPLPVDLLWRWGMLSRAKPALSAVSPSIPDEINSVRDVDISAHEASRSGLGITAQKRLGDRFRRAFMENDAISRQRESARMHSE